MLDAVITRLNLTVIRDQLDTLLAEAARRELTLIETVAYLCERDIARKHPRYIDMALGLARFPMERELSDYDFVEQPAVDKQHFKELATGRCIATGECLDRHQRNTQMINDRPLFVARAAMSPLFSSSSAMVSCPTLRSKAAMCWAVKTDSSSRRRSSVSSPA